MLSEKYAVIWGMQVAGIFLRHSLIVFEK